MWYSFLEQREDEVNLYELDGESEGEPEPKKSKSTTELKGKSAESWELIVNALRGRGIPALPERRKYDAVAIHSLSGRCATVPREICGSFRHRTRESVGRVA